jgi:hypothetical protein
MLLAREGRCVVVADGIEPHHGHSAVGQQPIDREPQADRGEGA